MLQRWKSILSNWISCYFDAGKNEQILNKESLLHIISHLRENLSLDESKSSLLEAHTVEEFIREKYPEFTFENGSAEAANEEKLCLSASLLLYFMCVNSKNLDMKQVMCSKLSSADQETILQFSKCLLECPVITVVEVQAAITEACGQDIAAMELPRQFSVAETPPALRSLHSEVRRLQAALDAERFDRNYLQDELTRTNARLERLLQEKEKHKLDVLNLKAKISLCCGEQTNNKHAEAATERSDTVTRELQLLKASLEEIQGQLDDVTCERDAYKTKMEELKNERDKWLALSQEENARVSQLTEQLETERHNIQTLRDLVSELQQHNRLNGLDTSSLECDDPDASIHSFQNNSSSSCEFPSNSSRSSRQRYRGRPRRRTVCSEICANVVEVQLGEERAKNVVFKQQIQTLQSQINELSKRAENEKQTLENVVAQKENDIFNLKHRINEEIEDKNNLKLHCDIEITKLNNEINELEQKFVDNNEHLRSIVEKKMAEIQTLQEEKLSLLQSLHDETTKLENIITDLKSELGSERQARSNMKEGYENHLMKLNEKVLNRNNELVELQNSIFDKGEQIETLQIELRKEKEAFNELKNEYRDLEGKKNRIENDLKFKRDEIQNLLTKLQQNDAVIKEMNMEIEQQKILISSLNENCKTLESLKEQLMNEISNRDVKIEETIKDINNINEVFQNEKTNLLQHLDERNATVSSLQTQLQNEIHFKVGLQNELTQIQIANNKLTEEFEALKSELSSLKSDMENKDKTIDAMDLYIQEEKKHNDQAREENQNLSLNIKARENDIKVINENLETTTKCLQEEIQKNLENVEMFRNNLHVERAERETLQSQFNTIVKEKSRVEKDLSVKCKEILMLRDECEELSQKLDDNVLRLKELEEKLHKETQYKEDLLLQKEVELQELQRDITKLILKNETQEQQFRDDIENKTQMIKTLTKDNEELQFNIKEDKIKHEVMVNENNALINKLEQQIRENVLKFEDLRQYSEELNSSWESYKLKTDFDAKEKEDKIAQLNDMSLEYETKINEINQEKSELTKQITEIGEKMKLMEENLATKENLLRQKEMDLQESQCDITKQISKNETQEQQFREDIENKTQMIKELKKDNEELRFNIKEYNIKHEDIVNEKNTIINKLEQQMRENILKFEDLRQYSEELNSSWESYKLKTDLDGKEKEDKISQLNDMSLEYETKINEFQQEKSELTKQIAEIEDKMKLMEENLAIKENLLRQKEMELQESQCDITKQISKNETQEQQFREDIENKTQIIKMLKKDNEELHFKIKEYNIKHEEIVNEKNSFINKLEQQMRENILKFEDLRRYSEELNSSWEIYKTKTDLDAKEKEDKISQLNEMALAFETKIYEVEREKSELTKHFAEIEDKMNLMVENMATKENILRDSVELEKQEVVKQHKELNAEFEKILASNLTLTDKFNHANSNNMILENEKKMLLSNKEKILQEKVILTQKLAEDMNVKEIAEEERKLLLAENKTIKEQLHKEMETSKTLVQEIDSLTQLLSEEKTVKEITEKEKVFLIAEKDLTEQKLTKYEKIKSEMEQETHNLNQQIETLQQDITKANEDLLTVNEENKKLIIELQKQTSFNDNLIEENQSMVKENNLLKKDLLDAHLTHEVLNNEKKTLEMCILHEKNACAEMKSVKEITEKEKELLVAEKELLNEKLIENENCNRELNNEKDNVNMQIHLLEQELMKVKEETMKQKEIQIEALQTELKRLEQVVNEHKKEHTKQSETYVTSMNSKIKDIQTLQQDNQTLHNELNDVKVQLEVKVHSLKEKLTDNENLTDKLKNSYECQIENLNVMITKLTNYLKDKTLELEALRKEKETLQQNVADGYKMVKTLEEEVKSEKQNIDKLMADFNSERQVLKNMVTVTESVMEDEKDRLNNIIAEHLLGKDCLQAEINRLKNDLTKMHKKCEAQEMAYMSLFSLLRLQRQCKKDVEKESEMIRDYLDELIAYLNKERNTNISVISALEFQEKVLAGDYEKMKNDLEIAQKVNDETKVIVEELENELKIQNDNLHKVQDEKCQIQNELQSQLTNAMEEKSQLEKLYQEKSQNFTVVQVEIKELKNKVTDLVNDNNNLELERKKNADRVEELTSKLDCVMSDNNKEIAKLKIENHQLLSTIEENKSVITNLEQLIKHELEENHKLRDNNDHEKLIMVNKCSILQDYQNKAEKELEERQKEIVTLKKEIETLQCKVHLCEQDSKAKDGLISKMSKEKDAIISTITKELLEEKATREKYERDVEAQQSAATELKNNMEIMALRKENDQLIRAIGQQETFTPPSQEKAADKYVFQAEHIDHHQVDNSSSDHTHSSVESLKTITDLEKIIHDKNRTITTLQTDITYLKSLVADSETSLLDVKKELEVSKENCQQLSGQLKKIVYQKNEEIAELKKQVTKMSAAENRASQIIRVSAKYQAMILKRVAEIKSNTILKELTNIGNTNNGDNELRRSLNAGTISMEDLENFLDTTDRHLKRCSEKQIALQKERDRLTEVNRINESEIINLKKFLTELTVSFQTFNSVKDLYGHKLSRVVSVQRTVRREILNLDGRISDAIMCKLERGYGAAMQDLSECTMNLERWVERCISRTVSVEKIKQAFTSDNERLSMSSPTFQNTGLEIQLEELEKSFQKLLEEVARAVKGEGATDSQASTVMEVRAEYEDKLNRMKAKMKDLFNEQMTVLKNKQREEIGLLERELQKTRAKMEESKRAYENHIRELTKELWNVGEKYLVKNDEAEWLRKKQRSGSLMSLQHMHSSGLTLPPEPPSRPSDAQSLRSLPIVTDQNTKKKRDGRGLHMSDEEGEVFDNRWLKELASTPRREPQPGQRLSELKWRNSLCPPHLKSSYPAETQFAPLALDEEDIKTGVAVPAKPQRKEVGICAYKKPGPPTPSKQAGRLSATDSELRESLRVESEPHAHGDRKTSTPGRLRAFLRFSKNDTNEGTPRARRLSNIFRKK